MSNSAPSHLNIREMRPDEIDTMTSYFLNSDEDYLRGMGIDPAKLPDAKSWRSLLEEDFGRELTERQFYYLFWEIDGIVSGHSNINQIVFGKEATMHLHLWQAQSRARGMGLKLIQKSIAKYFEKFDLEVLYCQPFAENPAPNRTLSKAGFTFLEEIECVPGWINFQQRIKRWKLTKAEFQ